MPCPAHGWPDWREEEDYAWLLEADRSAFAWEWLRRVRGYQEAFDEAQTGLDRPARERSAGQWGLVRFEPPERSSRAARPLWRRDRHPYVLEAAAEREGADSDRLDLGRFADLATIYVSCAGTEHLLLSDGLHGIRIDIASGSLRAGPARLRYQLAGVAGVDEPLMVLRRLLGLWRTGRFSPALHPREVRAARWVTMLRAHDALAAGATQREIAEALLSRDAATRRWRIAAPTVRLRAQRLVRGARGMIDGGYLALLKPGGAVEGYRGGE